MKIRFFYIFLRLGVLALPDFLLGQGGEISYSKPGIEHDTNYVKTFPDFVTSRLYLSRKYTGLLFEEQLADSRQVDYQPNTTLNLGIGATIKGFTLNLAYGFGFLNQTENQGETNYLDLQSHLYGRKYAADLFGQFYFGMYLKNSDFLLGYQPDSFYLRPDLSLILLGGSYFRVHNSDKFSYAASMVQNEWQKKSAGSVLWGGKAVLMSANSDSAMVPTFGEDSLFDSFKGVNRISSFQIGPGIGYAHTFVVDHHWFLTLAVEVNLMFGSIEYNGPDFEKKSEWQVNPSADFRFALGYNSARSYFGISYLNDNTQIKSVEDDINAVFSVGNVRLNYVKRFQMGPKLKQQIDKLPI